MLRLSVKRLGLRPARPLLATVAGHGQRMRTILDVGRLGDGSMEDFAKKTVGS